MFKMSRKSSIIRTVFIITMIMMVCTLSGCNKNNSNEAGSDAVQPEEKAALQIGEAGKTDTFEIAVTDVKRATEWTKDLDEGREYVIVAIKATNISKEEDCISAADFQYLGPDGKECLEQYSGVKTDPDTFGAEDIAPGDTFEGSIVFSMPIDMTQIELHYIEGYSKNPNLVFMFSK